jgi:hypothetical protein
MGGAFKSGDVGCMTGADTTELRAATELEASAVGGAEEGRGEPSLCENPASRCRGHL